MSKLLLISGVLLLSGCNTYGYQSTVDPYNDQYSAYIDRDQSECRQLASQASNGTAKETAIGAGVGGLIGGAAGAIVGAFTGNPGKGAAIGAAAGGFGGAAKQGYQADQRFKYAYDNCMENRNHRVYR